MLGMTLGMTYHFLGMTMAIPSRAHCDVVQGEKYGENIVRSG